MNVTVEIPENIYKSVALKAEKNNKRVDEVIVDLLEDELLIESDDFNQDVSDWSDEEVLALANLKMPNTISCRIDELQARLEAESITKLEQNELDIYTKSVQIATLRKAFGIVEAVRRGLIKSSKDLK